jgi:CubicO group peptidase (beta-lactamase class C family)
MNQKDLTVTLQREIDTLVSKNKDVFNAVLGITNTNGDFYWAGAAGAAYPDEPEAMKADTPIFIASITKMYTAAATMILAGRGLLSLDDPLSKFLPAVMLDGLHVYKGHDYSDQLRVYHLISQTSGLPDYFEERPKGGKSIFDQIVSSGDMAWNVEGAVRIARRDLSPKFPPESMGQGRIGNKAYYSDTNYQLLGAILESAAQKPLSELFSELIIEPLELSSTYLHGHRDPKAATGNPPATIYYKTKPLYLDKAMTSFGPDGGMVSTVEDSLKFLKHFTAGQLFERPSTLLQMKSWRKIFFPFQYGLGLMRFKLPRILSPFSATPELIGHSGASSAFLFHSEADQLYIGGTLNQLENRRRPFGLMLKVVKIVSESRSE